MKKSNVITGLTIIIVSFSTVVGFRLMDQPGENSITIDNPTQCRIGELVTLDAASSEFDSIVWTIDPETLNFKIINGGQQAIFSSEVPGEFTVTVATCKDNAVALAIIKLQVDRSLKIPRGSLGVKVDSGGIQGIFQGAIPFSSPQPKPRGNSKEPQVEPIGNLIDAINVFNWLPSDRTRFGKVISNLQTVDGLIDTNRFESKDEITQAAVWSVKRATNDSEAWKPFIVNYSNYLEKATSKQDCVLRTKYVLQSLKNAPT